jgi:tetratricopeptide (TPR) repeat protein
MNLICRAKFAVVCYLLLFSNSSLAQTGLKSAWEAFFNNKSSEAKTLFTAALNRPDDKKDALLGLALLAENDASQGNAFEYFSRFYDESKDSSPQVFSLWTTSVINGSTKKPEQLLAFLNKVGESKDIDGSLRAMAFSMLGKYYENKKDFAAADKYYGRIGAITTWSLLGEFENISGSGFNKDYEVLNNPESKFKNKNGAPISWFIPPYTRRDRWVDFTYHFDSGNSVIFAQNFVNSPIEQEVQLRVGVSGSVKAWVNDQLILVESDERNNDLDSYIQTVKLHKGYNRILIQIGESYAGRSNFMVRLTDSHGDPLVGITASAATQRYEKEESYQSNAINLFSEKYFAQQISLFPDNPLNYILLSKAYLRNDKDFESRRVLETLKEKYPNSLYLNVMLVEVFSRNGNKTGLESTQEAIKALQPEHPVALELLYASAVEKEDYKKAAEYTSKLEELVGTHDETVIAKRISLASFNKDQEELIRLTNMGYQKYPENSSIVELQYLIEKEIRKNSKGATAILKKYLSKNDNFNFAKALSDLYFSAGDADAGMNVLKQEIENSPVSVGIYNQVAQVYVQLQNYAKAEEFINKAIVLAPYIDGYHAIKAKIYEVQGKKAEAIEEYNKTVELNPNAYTAIKDLRKLEKKRDIDEYFPAADINKIIAAAPAASAYPDDNSIILDEDVQTVIYSGGGSEEYHRMLVKILTTKGLDNWKEQSVSVKGWQNYLIKDAEVVKAGGAKVPAEVNENQVVFTNLEVGDVIHLGYKLYNYSKGQLANKFWDTFYFSHGYPYLKTSYNLLIAKSQSFNYKLSQNDIVPIKTSMDEFDLYTWSQQNQASLKYEDKMPPIDDVANVLHLTTLPSWDYVSNWYNDLASAKAKPNYEVKEVVKTLFSKQANLSPLQKVQAIYDYITTNITYSSVSFRQSGLVPQKPSTVLNTRIGDCKDVSTLFVSMAKEAGLDARLVLVNTHDNGIKSLILPSIDFNHCMVKVNAEGKEHYLELTSNFLPFSTIDRGSLNSLILDIDEASVGRSLKPLNPATRKHNLVSRKTKITTENNDLIIMEDNYRVASAAAYLREVYADISEKEQLKKMQETIRQTSPTAELIKLSFSNLNNTVNRDTVFSKIHYRIKEDIKSIGGISIVTLPWYNKALTSDFTVAEPRLFPLDLTQIYSMDNESEEIVFTIPAGKAIVENIAPVKLSNEYIDYSLALKQIGNTITYSRSFKLKKDLIPARDVKAFEEFYKKIVVADNKQIALSK